MHKLLTVDPNQRFSAAGAVQDDWIQDYLPDDDSDFKRSVRVGTAQSADRPRVSVSWE